MNRLIVSFILCIIMISFSCRKEKFIDTSSGNITCSTSLISGGTVNTPDCKCPTGYKQLDKMCFPVDANSDSELFYGIGNCDNTFDSILIKLPKSISISSGNTKGINLNDDWADFWVKGLSGYRSEPLKYFPENDSIYVKSFLPHYRNNSYYHTKASIVYVGDKKDKLRLTFYYYPQNQTINIEDYVDKCTMILSKW